MKTTRKTYILTAILEKGNNIIWEFDTIEELENRMHEAKDYKTLIGFEKAIKTVTIEII